MFSELQKEHPFLQETAQIGQVDSSYGMFIHKVTEEACVVICTQFRIWPFFFHCLAVKVDTENTVTHTGIKLRPLCFTLKIEEPHSYETLVNLYHTVWHHKTALILIKHLCVAK